MNNKRENLVVGLDIGTTKICAIVGAITDEGLDIVGIGTSPSSGLRKEENSSDFENDGSVTLQDLV